MIILGILTILFLIVPTTFSHAQSQCIGNQSTECGEYLSPLSLSPEKIHYELYGWNNPGTPIIFIHGSGHNLETNKVFIHQLAMKYKVLSYDLRGHGKTPALGLNYSPTVLSEDLKGLLDYLQLGRVYLIGHSFGAKIAVEFASTFPKRSESLAIIDMEFIPRNLSSTDEFIRTLKRGRSLIERIPKRFSTYNEFDQHLRSFYGPRLDSMLIHSSLRDDSGILPQFHPAVDFFLFGNQMNQVDQTISLQKLELPVLFIGGTEYQATSPLGLDHLRSNVDGLEVEVIKGAGHSPQLSHAEQFLRLIQGFFGKNTVSQNNFPDVSESYSEQTLSHIQKSSFDNFYAQKFMLGKINSNLLYRDISYGLFEESRELANLPRKVLKSEYQMALISYKTWNFQKAKKIIDKVIGNSAFQHLSDEQFVQDVKSLKKKIKDSLESQFDPNFVASNLRRSLTATPEGATIQHYNDSLSAIRKIGQSLELLSRSSSEMRELIQGLTVMLPPRDKGIDFFMEFDESYSAVEGTSYALPSFNKHFQSNKVVAIRENSISRWCEGLAHEILHIYVRERPDLISQLRQLRHSSIGYDHDDTAEHLFVYLGQYYLTGYKNELQLALSELLGQQAGRELYGYITDSLGTAKCWQSDFLTSSQALFLIRRLIATYQGNENYISHLLWPNS